MKCIILCAGFVDKKFNLEPGIPRALLKIKNDKTILDYMVEKVEKLDEVSEIIITTNNTYIDSLSKWIKTREYEIPITVINDMVNNKNETLGAVGDVEYIINYENIDDDILILLGDNLFDFDLEKIINFYKHNKSLIITGKLVEEDEDVRRFGIFDIDDSNKVTSFLEKSDEDLKKYKSMGIYIIPKEIVPIIKQYLEEGNRTETPGYFIEYITKFKDVYAYINNSIWFDINENKDLIEAREVYKEKN